MAQNGETLGKREEQVAEIESMGEAEDIESTRDPQAGSNEELEISQSTEENIHEIQESSHVSAAIGGDDDDENNNNDVTEIPLSEQISSPLNTDSVTEVNVDGNVETEHPLPVVESDTHDSDGDESQLEQSVLDVDKNDGALPTGTQIPIDMIAHGTEKENQSESNQITITIVNESPPHRPFLGGFRHKITQKEYHHAYSQTNPLPRRKKPHGQVKEELPKFARETQTKRWLSRTTQTNREQGTQMEKPGLCLDDSKDVTHTQIDDYFDSEQMFYLQLEKSIIIQSYYRAWKACKIANSLRDLRDNENEKLRAEQFERQELEIAKKRNELAKRMHPRTQADFDVLYIELEQWRTAETLKIKEKECTEEEKKAALVDLLRKETKLLQTIDRLKNSAAKENRHETINKKLENLAQAKRMKAHDGGTILIETPFTIRARELMDLYHGLKTEMLSVDERLDVLLHVKWTVKEFDCHLTRDIVELIDREADLLNRGRKDKALEGLRRRLANLFLQFIETPEFNPEAVRTMKVPIEYAIRPQVMPIVKK